MNRKMCHEITILAETIARARRRLIALHYEANCGHVGGNLSSLEALMTLFHVLMKPQDRFVLSKGHSAGALYVALWSKNLLTDDELQTFSKDNTLLPGHPSGDGIPGLLFSTGSLGHGPSLCAGLALAARHQQSGRHIWCLCSDGEWQEGACWEALIFSVHQKLDNLTLLVDQNGLQGFGTTEEVASLQDLTPHFTTFGADASLIDGHSPQAIVNAARSRSPQKPKVIVLKTLKGKGTSLEGQVACHYLPLSDADFAQSQQGTEEA